MHLLYLVGSSCLEFVAVLLVSQLILFVNLFRSSFATVIYF